MERYHKLYLACLAGMFFSLAVSVVIYVCLDIGTAIRVLTGIGSGMRKKNRRNGRKRRGKTAVMTAALLLLCSIHDSGLPVRAQEELVVYEKNTEKPEETEETGGPEVSQEEQEDPEPEPDPTDPDEPDPEKEAMRFDVTYNQAERLVWEASGDPARDKVMSVPRTGYRAYYQDEIQVLFSLTRAEEKKGEEEDSDRTGATSEGPDGFILTVTGREAGLFTPVVDWKRSENGYEGSFVLTEEDSYEILMEYEDADGTPMEAGSADGSRWDVPVSEEGRYESVVLVLDRTAPDIRISCTDQSWEEICMEEAPEVDGMFCFTEPLYLKIEVEGKNLRYHEIRKALQKMQVCDNTRSPIAESGAELFLAGIDGGRRTDEGIVWYLPLTTEAIYEIPVECEDLAGNRTAYGVEKFLVDWSGPEAELSYEIQDTGFLDVIRYRNMAWLFADRQLFITVSAVDPLSKVSSVVYRITEEDGRVTEGQKELSPVREGSFQLSLPLKGEDFKGTLTVEVYDQAGNAAILQHGYVIESEKMHEQSGEAVIHVLTEPSRTVGGTDYYNTDVRFRFSVMDTCSGLRSVFCTGGNGVHVRKDYAGEAKKAPEEERREGIVCEHSEELLLEAASNQGDEIWIQVGYEDNTGHTGQTEQSFRIDITAPVVEVEYDLNSPQAGRFYNQPRTASVTVRERNFDPADLEFQITSTEGNMPVIGGWTESGSGDDRMHRCEIVFLEDGDYTFTLEAMDLAGNRAVYDRIDEFTIDRIRPEVTVAWDLNQRDTPAYYGQKRTAVVSVLEHNFDASLMEVTVTGTDEALVPMLSDWTEDGDRHTAALVFEADGAYELSVSGMDPAGNQMEDYRAEPFVIDRTPPVLEITGIRDQSANHGTVAPVIRCRDDNYVPGSLTISLEGVLHGTVEPSGTDVEFGGGAEFQMDDFGHTPQADDLYRLNASVMDPAGNISEETINFSVNRFGSVYILEGEARELAESKGEYYTGQGPDLIVTEVNADTLEFQEITCSFNGRLRTLEQGRDYRVKVVGTEKDWKQYTYMIDRSNFQEEGYYILTIYSEDRAENASDNRTKGKQLEFAVDRTSPSILLSGLEDGGIYKGNDREITLDLQDNMCMGSAEITLNGEKTAVYQARELQTDGRITLSLNCADHWQTIGVVAYDAAGNRQEFPKMRFLLTSNTLLRLFMNRYLFYGLSGGMAAIWAVAWYLFIGRGRRKGERKTQ